MIRLALKKYRKALLVSLGVYIVIALFTIYGILRGRNFIDFTPLIPIKHNIYEYLCIFLIIPVSAFLGALIGGYLIAPTYLLSHKIFYRKMIYGIQISPLTQKYKQIFLGYYPALLAFHINSIILLSFPDILNRILSPQMMSAEIDFTLRYAAGVFVLMIFTIGLSLMVFSPAWFLIDAGIIYSTQNHVRGTERPFEVRTVGGWFYDYLKGYSGFGVLLSYLQIIYFYYSNYIIIGGRVDIVEFIFIFGLPIYIMLTIIPSLILLDLIKKHRVNYVRNIAAKIGITDIVEIFFEEVK